MKRKVPIYLAVKNYLFEHKGKWRFSYQWYQHILLMIKIQEIILLSIVRKKSVPKKNISYFLLPFPLFLWSMMHYRNLHCLKVKVWTSVIIVPLKHRSRLAGVSPGDEHWISYLLGHSASTMFAKLQLWENCVSVSELKYSFQTLKFHRDMVKDKRVSWLLVRTHHQCSPLV